MNLDLVKSQAAGKWLGIYNQLGIDVGTGKHGPCPVCGGKDRFRYDDRNGNGDYICNQCGAGDGITLIQKARGVDFKEAVSIISDIVGVVESDDKDFTPPPDPRRALNEVWKTSAQIEPNDLASKYLRTRGLVLTPLNIRFSKSCYESDTKKTFPAMIARVQSKEGRPVTLHRTYLDGFKKANIQSPKKLMPGTESLSGATIRLFSPHDPMFLEGTLGIAEGIETAIATSQLFGVATWAVISTSIMQGFEPPKDIRKIIIYGDNDSNFAGQKAAYTLANKLYLADYLVDVQIPVGVGDDWNDVLRDGV